MKRAVILHGTDNNPTELWLPWIIEQLKLEGYHVFAPLLPGNHSPNRQVYDKFLRNSGWDFTDNIIVGHSSGATTLLNLLSSEWFPKIRAAVLVGTFLNLRLLEASPPKWYDLGQFKDLFLASYDPAAIDDKCDRFIFVHGSDDPYCDIEDARRLCNELKGVFIEILGGGHLASSSGVKELPQIIQQLRSDKIL